MTKLFLCNVFKRFSNTVFRHFLSIWGFSSEFEIDPKMTDVSSQTDFDVVDALRINPFLLSKHPKNEERLPKLKRNVIPVVQKPTLRLSKPIEEECYSVENERRGICLVLEHDTFSPNLQLRYVLNFPQKWFFKPKTNCLKITENVSFQFFNFGIFRHFWI